MAGYILQEAQKEDLEIIIFKDLSSSTTHPIETDLKKVIGSRYILSNLKVYKSPLSEAKN